MIVDFPRRCWDRARGHMWRLGDHARLAGDPTPLAVTEIALIDDGGEPLLGLSERGADYGGRFFVRLSRAELAP